MRDASNFPCGDKGKVYVHITKNCDKIQDFMNQENEGTCVQQHILVNRALDGYFMRTTQTLPKL